MQPRRQAPDDYGTEYLDDYSYSSNYIFLSLILFGNINMPSPPPATANKDYYEILNIPSSDPSAGKLPVISKQQLKIAYHKALLKYHPDKSSPSPFPAPTGGSNTYTIDEITNAYKVLSDPSLRAEYDRDLILQRRNDTFNKKSNGGENVSFHTGLEVVDLEDMDEQFDEGEGTLSWYRGCRCGDEKGFIVTEDELEAEAQHGEILFSLLGSLIRDIFPAMRQEACSFDETFVQRGSRLTENALCEDVELAISERPFYLRTYLNECDLGRLWRQI
ncbi:DnaJ domain protein [Talaromyces stipitatus ATCC 10500]|uniref:Diphthamide biosynthesis protein 4 n=1 Tax=Talaromyces stipitatus (strain ATCC 10500 / CBS 375.48 / QM 6759 / NRRL 1006) TaxID=441959 RepID=B8ME70_TALSN|nr:DnaJ domain protein [Talaromyces stipitatus ATCC 10500]EED16497.1 DnaJ domain protein [Talaromyces stipitatus ATCC 10500]